MQIYTLKLGVRIFYDKSRGKLPLDQHSLIFRLPSLISLLVVVASHQSPFPRQESRPLGLCLPNVEVTFLDVAKAKFRDSRF